MKKNIAERVGPVVAQLEISPSNQRSRMTRIKFPQRSVMLKKLLSMEKKKPTKTKGNLTASLVNGGVYS